LELKTENSKLKTEKCMNRVLDLVSARFSRELPSSRLAPALILLAFCLAPAHAQQTAAVPAPNEETTASASAPASVSLDHTAAEQRYRIGPGDVLDVKVFNKPQFTRDGVKVDPRGRIRMPLIKEEIEAACRTEEELEATITELLKEFIREPQVTVQIKEYLAEPVAVLGAVRAPSRFQLQRRVSLLEILTYVNGPADNAGRTIQVVHTGARACEQRGRQESSETVASQIDYYKLSDTLRGEEKSNPYLRAGDVVSIPVADQVFVIGNVIQPTAIALTEPMTVSRAIAMAGGTALDTKKNAIQIIRQIPGTTDKKEIVVDLDAINKHQAEDVVLLANDIVDVPASGGKRFLRSLMGGVVPSVASLPVRVIP
jgi:polysaccharide export outer membrane protein